MTVALDHTTLTEDELGEILAALFELPGALEADALAESARILPRTVAATVALNGTPEDAVRALWLAFTRLGRHAELVKNLEPGATSQRGHALAVIARLELLAAGRSPLIEGLTDVQNRVTTVPGWEKVDDVWRHVCLGPLLVGSSIDLAELSLPRLLLKLCDLPADEGTAYFPLFTYLDGLLLRLFTGPNAQRLEYARASLDVIARKKGFSDDGIARLRRTVQADAAAAGHSEPSLMVWIRRPDDVDSQDQYAFTLYQWRPGPADGRRTAGQAEALTEEAAPANVFGWADHAKGEARRTEAPGGLQAGVAEALARHLRRGTRPLVEFIVPSELLAEPFEALVVSLPHPLRRGQTEPKRLMEVARVVVRVGERVEWCLTSDEMAQNYLANWRRRWGRYLREGAGYKNWLLFAERPDHLSWINLNNYADAVCLGSGFPVGVGERPEGDMTLLEDVVTNIVEWGLPMAVWCRCAEGEGWTKSVRGIVTGENGGPPDLRDRVWDTRVDATQSLRASLTLLWDDPDRLPERVEPLADPLGG